MTARQEKILEGHVSVGLKFQKGYTYIGQGRQLYNLKKYHGFKICRRTLNYDLRELEDQGYIERKRRHRRGKDGRFLPHSTMTFLKGKAYQWINQVQALAGKLRAFTVVQRAAHNRLKTARYFRSVDNLAGSFTSVLQKGWPSAAIRSP